MEILPLILTVLGLAAFETVSSVDNAVINAEVLATMRPKARKWFLVWGLVIGVFVVRGFLPWLIVWISSPALGFIGSLTATFSNDPRVHDLIASSTPILLTGGGVFLFLLFFHWLFVEDKEFGLHIETFFSKHSVWFFTFASVFLAIIVWFALQIAPLMAFAAVVGSSAFFITHGFKQSAEATESRLKDSSISDVSKLLYLEVIDMTFSIDGVLGAFAFTVSVPLILAGNGIGALVVRQLTIGNIERIKKYRFLKNGAMYSILALGVIMLLDAFGAEVPSFVSPIVTFAFIGFFFTKSVLANRRDAK